MVKYCQVHFQIGFESLVKSDVLEIFKSLQVLSSPFPNLNLKLFSSTCQDLSSNRICVCILGRIQRQNSVHVPDKFANDSTGPGWRQIFLLGWTRKKQEKTKDNLRMDRGWSSFRSHSRVPVQILFSSYVQVPSSPLLNLIWIKSDFNIWSHLTWRIIWTRSDLKIWAYLIWRFLI